MQQPSLDLLMQKMDSKYELVVAVAKRARKLTEAEEASGDEHAMKPVSIALDEIASGDLRIIHQDDKNK
jgi:DNA-directed RNA polymerase subunit omega